MLRQGDDVNLRGHETRRETLIRQAEQTLALDYAEQLLGPRDPARRPEPRARSTGHDDRQFFHVSTIQDWRRAAYNNPSCPTRLKLSSSIEQFIASADGAN